MGRHQSTRSIRVYDLTYMACKRGYLRVRHTGEVQAAEPATFT